MTALLERDRRTSCCDEPALRSDPVCARDDSDTLGQFRAGHRLEGFAIFRGRLLDDLGGQGWAGRSLVPIERLEIIAHELFVETRRALADDVLIRRPETRGIGRETFVDQEQFAVDRAEFEFCVGDDDSAFRGVFAAAE